MGAAQTSDLQILLNVRSRPITRKTLAGTPEHLSADSHQVFQEQEHGSQMCYSSKNSAISNYDNAQQANQIMPGGRIRKDVSTDHVSNEV